ncbi:MAG: Y-family DNA polymerase [Solirubrobacterales bacterium]
MRRFVHLWLPLFPTDRLTRGRGPLAEWRRRPLATVTRAAGSIRIADANPAAQEAGVVPGLPAADAQAVCPGLKTVPADPDQDAATLGQMAEWCQRWTPWTAPEGDRAVWLDITGCAHLFGGERTMVDDMLARVGALGFRVRAGLADTPGAAWAMSRFGDGPAAICPEGAARQWLSSFPVAALRLPPESAETLRRLGVRRIGELMALPRAPLVARFGEIAARRLDQMLGRAPEPISPRPAEEPVSSRLAFAEPVGRTEDVAAAIHRLLDSVCGRLTALGLGARRLVLRVFRVDGSVLAQGVGTSEAVRDPAHLMRLFAEGLDGLDAGFGIEVMTMTVAAADPFAGRQADLEARPEAAGLALLLDRLARRLGPAALFRPAPAPSALPERQVTRLPPLAVPQGGWPRQPRPVRLLPRPEPVIVDHVNGVPARLARRGMSAAIIRAEGPERLAAEWWHGESPPPYEARRDYWRVEDVHGRRLWLFQGRDGWFVHGLLG